MPAGGRVWKPFGCWPTVTSTSFGLGESISGIASVTAAGVVITPTDVPQLAQRILMQYSRFS
jgi:hypothetical protein